MRGDDVYSTLPYSPRLLIVSSLSALSDHQTLKVEDQTDVRKKTLESERGG